MQIEPPESDPAPAGDWNAWRQHLRALADDVRRAVRDAPDSSDDARPARRGVGDWTYGIDLAPEEAAERWLAGIGARAPLSLLTEDSGWLHAPDAHSGFAHGGPRIVLDPIDGTRVLMLGLRPAWTEIAWCPAGSGVPRLSDVRGSLLAELPGPRAARYRVLEAGPDGPATLEQRDILTDAVLERRTLDADAHGDAVEHRVLSFFRYEPRWRPRLARIEAAFFEGLETGGIDPRHCFDDQYLSNAGQLVMLALGSYAFVCDLRAHLAAEAGEEAVTSKPYDCAGAIRLARAAGCVVEAPDGGPLDFPLDAETPVSFAAYANAAVAARLRPHLVRAL